MKSWMVPPLVAVAVLALLVLSAVNSTDPSGDSDQTRDAAAHSHTHGKHDKGDKSEKREKRDKGDRGLGHGPPPWAHRHDSTADSSAREMWRKLTPEQRRSLMAELVREHAQGMREWEECVAAERDDCVMPFPPGLAKRR